MSAVTKESPPSIFQEQRFNQSVAEIEFRHFRQEALKDYRAICESISRFGLCDREFSFSVDTGGGPYHLQFDFGRRSMFKKDQKGKLAVEKGPSLVYSLGYTSGFAAVILYPASSTLGNVTEDHLFLRTGRLSGYQLHSNLKSDLETLVAYVFVSSIETTPSHLDSLRFWWLRKSRSHSVDKEFVEGVSAGRMLVKASSSILSPLMIAIMRPLGVVIAVAILLYFGYFDFADLLRPGR